MADQIKTTQVGAQAEYGSTPQIKTTQVGAQAEYGSTPQLKLSHFFAQAEHQPPPLLRLVHFFMQVEYAIGPNVPGGVLAVGGIGQNTISWEPVAGADSYNLYWGFSSGISKSTGTKITGATSPHIHSALLPETTYYYFVTAVEAGIESGESAVVSATTVVPVSAGRTPLARVIITLDFCGRTFGVDPCLATGTPCYNTWATCKYYSAFLRQQRDYLFSEPPQPFDNVRPYVKSLKILPTEIKSSLTVNSRINVEFYDDAADLDVETDPYWSQRSSHPGTFWKRLLARNPNYRRRRIRIFEGYLGDSEEYYKERWNGVLENIILGKGVVRLEAVDLLRDLSKIEVPPKLDSKLAADIDAAVTFGATLTSVDGLDASGYIRLDTEIIGYASVNTEARQILTLTRGALRTVADEHQTNAKVQKCRVYGPKNWCDLLKDDLLKADGTMTDSDLNLPSFADAREWPTAEVLFFAVVSEPTKLSNLVTELVDLLDARIWIGEDLKVTVRRNIPNAPGREYYTITDENHILSGSASVDLNEKARLTRCAIYWDKNPIGALDDVLSYSRLEVAVDAAAESPNAYGEMIEKKIFCRWLSATYMQEELAAQAVKNFAGRKVLQAREGQTLVSFDLDLKDNAIKTGDWVLLTTDEVLLPNGSPIPGFSFQVVKREMKAGKIGYQLLKTSDRRYCIIGPSGQPDYMAASAAQREYGYIAGSAGKMSNGDPGYHPY
jgi:hypothetical protein